jgi:hypothetical protein
MDARAYDWVTLHEASEAVKVSATTIRDWYVSGRSSRSPLPAARVLFGSCRSKTTRPEFAETGILASWTGSP